MTVLLIYFVKRYSKARTESHRNSSIISNSVTDNTGPENCLVYLRHYSRKWSNRECKRMVILLLIFLSLCKTNHNFNIHICYFPSFPLNYLCLTQGFFLKWVHNWFRPLPVLSIEKISEHFSLNYDSPWVINSRFSLFFLDLQKNGENNGIQILINEIPVHNLSH